MTTPTGTTTTTPDLLRSLTPSPPPASIQAAAELHARGGLATLSPEALEALTSPERMAALSLQMCAELTRQHTTIRTYGRLILLALAARFGLDLDVVQSLLGQ